MATASPTDKFQLAEHLIGGDLRGYVNQKRADGKSWHRISRDLLTDTNGVIDVTVQTLRNWFPEILGAAEKAS